MDPIITTMINGGIGIGMATLVVWHVWYTQTKQIPTLLTTFENQMGKEREAAQLRLTTEREISQMRHNENIAQMTLLLTSVREGHHTTRNLTNVTSLLGTKIDVVLGLRSKEDAKKLEDEIRKKMDEEEKARRGQVELHSVQKGN